MHYQEYSKLISMEKIKKFIKVFDFSIVCLALGIYLVTTANFILGTLVGIVNIGFWGILILWAIFKIYINPAIKH
jgi:hypothetical protein